MHIWQMQVLKGFQPDLLTELISRFLKVYRFSTWIRSRQCSGHSAPSHTLIWRRSSNGILVALLLMKPLSCPSTIFWTLNLMILILWFPQAASLESNDWGISSLCSRRHLQTFQGRKSAALTDRKLWLLTIAILIFSMASTKFLFLGQIMIF